MHLFQCFWLVTLIGKYRCRRGFPAKASQLFGFGAICVIGFGHLFRLSKIPLWFLMMMDQFGHQLGCWTFGSVLSLRFLPHRVCWPRLRQWWIIYINSHCSLFPHWFTVNNRASVFTMLLPMMFLYIGFLLLASFRKVALPVTTAWLCLGLAQRLGWI